MGSRVTGIDISISRTEDGTRVVKNEEITGESSVGLPFRG